MLLHFPGHAGKASIIPTSHLSEAPLTLQSMVLAQTDLLKAVRAEKSELLIPCADFLLSCCVFFLKVLIDACVPWRSISFIIKPMRLDLSKCWHSRKLWPTPLSRAYQNTSPKWASPSLGNLPLPRLLFCTSQLNAGKMPLPEKEWKQHRAVRGGIVQAVLWY